jgi:hypothetical protein
MGKEIEQVADGISIEHETLEDRSVLHNVVSISASGRFRFGMVSESDARDLAELLTRIAWIEADLPSKAPALQHWTTQQIEEHVIAMRQTYKTAWACVGDAGKCNIVASYVLEMFARLELTLAAAKELRQAMLIAVGLGQYLDRPTSMLFSR